MTFATINKTSRRLIGAKPLQSCLHCSPALSDCRPILRSQLLGWRVTCPSCGELLSDPDGLEVASPFLKYRQAALPAKPLGFPAGLDHRLHLLRHRIADPLLSANLPARPYRSRFAPAAS